MDFCMKIHKELIKEFQYVLVCAPSVKHISQKVDKNHLVRGVECHSGCEVTTTPAFPMTRPLPQVLSGFGSHWIRIQGREVEVSNLEFHLPCLAVTLYIELYKGPKRKKK